MGELVRVEEDGRVRHVVLDRPEKANALSKELLDEFSDALQRLASDGGAVIGIRGEGRGFSAGFDLDQVGGFTVRAHGFAHQGRELLMLRLRHVGRQA